MNSSRSYAVADGARLLFDVDREPLQDTSASRVNYIILLMRLHTNVRVDSQTKCKFFI